MTTTTAPTFRVLSGCDVVDLDRLSASLDRRPGFLSRVFTDREVADARRDGVEPGSPTELARLGARFAAKEATRKALGDLRLGFHEVEVRTAEDGAPVLHVHGEPSPLAVSLSHDAGVAMAVVTGVTSVPQPAPSTPCHVAAGGRVALEMLSD